MLTGSHVCNAQPGWWLCVTSHQQELAAEFVMGPCSPDDKCYLHKVSSKICSHPTQFLLLCAITIRTPMRMLRTACHCLGFLDVCHQCMIAHWHLNISIHMLMIYCQATHYFHALNHVTTHNSNYARTKNPDVSTSWRQPWTMATLYNNWRSMKTQGMHTHQYSIQSTLYTLEHIRCLASGVREIRVRYYGVFWKSCCTSLQCDAIWLQTTFINVAWDL